MSFTCTAANIFGDWLMVYPLQRGVAGAAIATGVANLPRFDCGFVSLHIEERRSQGTKI